MQNRRAQTARHRCDAPHLVMWFVVLLLGLRAFVPAGFMPSVDALRDGRFVMTICSGAGGMRTVVVDSHGDLLADSVTASNSDTDAQTHGQDDPSLHLEHCPFGALSALAALPSVAPVLTVPAMAALFAVDAPVHAALPPLPAQGPPLGSRAPPSALG